LRVLTPSQTAVYIYLVPVFGLLSARLVLGETITAYLVLGGATILAGVVLTNSARAPRRAPRRTQESLTAAGAVDGAD
jgi:drug/metabolite transporter (DMT)-like permease